MDYQNLGSSGVITYSSDIKYDDRGNFIEIYNQSTLELIRTDRFIQQNLVQSNLNVIRGMHWQEYPFEQSKLITVLKGKILDVFLDLRADSETFNRVFTVELDSKYAQTIFIPTGFAHGYQALEQDTLISYCVTSKYSPDHEKRINPLSKKFKGFWKEPYLIGELDLHSIYQDD
jgi:dTDP-4-dehydrorhamnose 3,5-epimerase